MEEVLRITHKTLLDARRAHTLVSSSRFSDAWEAATEEQKAALKSYDHKSIEVWVSSIKIKVDYKAWAIAKKIPNASRLNIPTLRRLYEQSRTENSVTGRNEAEIGDVDSDAEICRFRAGDAEQHYRYAGIKGSREVAGRLLKNQYGIHGCVHTTAYWGRVLAEFKSNRHPERECF